MAVLYILLRFGLTVQHQRNRPVVHQRNLHIGTKNALLYY